MFSTFQNGLKTILLWKNSSTRGNSLMKAFTIKVITPILKQNVSLICVNSSTKDGVMGEVFCNTIVFYRKGGNS